jgi:hypothetical protein
MKQGYWVSGLILRRRLQETASPRKFLGFFLIVAGIAVPSRSEQSTPKDTAIEVRELVDGGSTYTNRIVTVHGCLVKEFEIKVLQPCGAKFDQFSKYSVWVDDIDDVVEDAKRAKTSSFIPAQSAYVLKNGRGELWTLDSVRDRPLSIVVEGEYQVSRTRKFGHLDFYRRRFIVHRLLDHAAEERSPTK